MGGSPGSTRNQLEPITAVCNPPTHIHNRNRCAQRPPEWQHHISGQPQDGENPPEDFLLHSSFYPSALPRPPSLDLCATQRLGGPALRHPQSRKSRAIPTRSLLEPCSEEAIQATPLVPAYRGPQRFTTEMRTPGEKHLSGPNAFRFSHERLALVAESDDTECAATVVVVPGGEEELIGIAVPTSRAALAELNSPDIVNLDRLPARITQRAEESAALWIKGVDAPMGSVVRDEKRVAHGSKVSRRQRDAPRRMERTSQGKVRHQISRGGEGVHKTALRFVERSIGNPNRFRAIRCGDRLNPIRREFLRNFWVDKSIPTKVDQVEIGVEYVDP